MLDRKVAGWLQRYDAASDSGKRKLFVEVVQDMEHWWTCAGNHSEANYELETEVEDLRKQVAIEQTGRETWPESLLETVDAGGGYTYMVPPPARKWVQGWRKREK